MDNNKPNSSGMGIKYFTMARSAYALACNSAAAKQMLIQPQLAFSYNYKDHVARLADLSQDQVRNLILHHGVSVTSECHMDALSGIFQLANYCQSKNILNDLAALNLSVKCDRYCHPAIALTKQMNDTIIIKKENKILANKLKRVLKTTRALVTNTLRFEDIIQNATDLSEIEELEMNEKENKQTIDAPL